MLLLNVSLAFADGDHQSEIEEGRELVESKISCDKLNDEQLEAIGEYLMEQMHPGESHEAMHKMMGIEEGTEYHEQFHVNMAKMMYCDTNYTTYGSMMGSRGMMGGGMMMPMMRNMMMGSSMMGSGMMGNYPRYYSYGYDSFWSTFWSILLIVMIILIIWVIYKLTRKEKGSETPINILQKRYAKGEINKKQFEEIKREIGE